MIKELHHIGIAVHSLRDALPRYTDQLGLVLDGIEDVPNEGVKVAVLWAGRTRIELVEPLNEASPIAKFLAKRGPGVHHLAFKVDSTGAMLKVLIDSGAPVIHREPQPGAHGTKIAFLHPRLLDGVLAELVEDPPEASS
jgi:methylmalonyl-CoA/ethylmalonyl-CoA epimerase